MPIYTIETPNGRKLKIEAADEATALAGAEEWHAQNGTATPAAPALAAAAPTSPSASAPAVGGTPMHSDPATGSHPVIEVEGPGGVIVEFPHGTPRDVMSKAMAAKFGQPSAVAPAPAPAAAPAAPQIPPGMPAPGATQSPPDVAALPEVTGHGGVDGSILNAMFPCYGGAAAIANGMTFGTLPNIQAGIGAGVNAAANAVGLGDGQSISDTYARILEGQQAERRGFDQRNPIVSPVLNAAGGVATGAGLAGNGVTVVGRMANQGLSNLLPRTVAGAAEGAAYAGAAGFGGGEGGFDNRLKGAKDNLIAGAVLGGAMPAVTNAVGGTVRMARDAYLGVADPARRADELIVRALGRDRSSPAALADAVEAAGAAGQPDYRALDAAGRNAQRLAGTAARTPGEFRETAATTLAQRQAAQGERIGGYVDDALGSGAGAFETEQGLIAGRRAAARQLYDEAFAAPPPAGEFYDELSRRPIVQQAVRNMERAAADSLPGTPGAVSLPEMTSPAGLSMRGWDYVKRYLDGHVNALFSSADADQRALAPVYRDLRDALRGRLGEDNPAYSRALARYADDATSLEAIETGRNVVRARNPDAPIAALRGLGEGDRGLAREGASREIGVKLENARSGQDKTLIFDTPAMQRRLDALTDDPIAGEVLASRLGRERDMVRSARSVTGGSDTFERLADAADTEGAQFLADVLMGRKLSAGARALGAAKRAATGLNENSAAHLGDYLLSADPSRIRALEPAFREAMDAAERPSIAPAVMAAAVNAPRQENGRKRRQFATR